ncbi:MAG: hypothetical protein HY812_07555 [Planctomycetes bacterium]|nr:hypothetical protein [Planctomycetota bacterium]
MARSPLAALRPLLLASLLGCAQAAAPVWYVPARLGLSLGQGDQTVAQALADLGYEILGFDEPTGTYVTGWRNTRSVLGPTRFRALVRIESRDPFGVAVAVPEELFDGRSWTASGEDELRRKELVATLAARLQEPGS